MLRRDERRALEEIERHLIAEDPEWAGQLGSDRPVRSGWPFSARVTLAGLAAVLGVALLFLGQVGSAFLAAALAGALLLSRKVHLRA